MTQRPKLEKAHVSAWPLPLPNVPEAVQAQSQAWFERQAEFVEHTQQMMAGWMKRRHEGIEAWLRAVQELNGCRDLASAAGICNDWLDGSMRRMMSDMSEARDEAFKLIEIGQSSLASLVPSGAEAAKGGERRAAAE